MKKITVLILLALLCVTANATDMSVNKKKKKKTKTEAVKPAAPVIITQTIWGCTVGTSTRKQVADSLTSRGYAIEEADGVLTATGNDMKFGGLSWSTAVFHFSEGKLMDISFESQPYESFHAAESADNSLISKLNEKYKDQHDMTAKDNSNYVKYDLYKDTYTSISLGVKQYSETRLFKIALIYTNLYLRSRYGKEDVKEL